MTTQICNTCNIEKPFSDFNKGAGYKTGYRKKCKACVKAAYDADPKIIAKRAAREKRRAEAPLRRRQRYLEQREANLAYQREYHKKNPHKSRETSLRYIRKKAEASKGLSSQEVYAIKCIYAEAKAKTKETGIKHEVDHIVPISLGGKHHPDNLQILTATENKIKKDQFDGTPTNKNWKKYAFNILN
jgi:5-methylcytosine-specific restriction endonuclease McrA